MSSKPKEPSIVRIVKLLETGEYTTAEIATKLGLSKASVRSLVSLLASLGMVKKEKLPRVSYSLTEYGKEGLEKLGT